MTNQKINRFLAEKLMGWSIFIHRSFSIYEYWVEPGAAPYDWKFSADGKDRDLPLWNPAQDRNQLALCLEKAGEMGEDVRRDLINAMLPYDAEEIRPFEDCWNALTTPPQTIAQAIVEVLEE